MNKDEKSLLDELWQAMGMEAPEKASPKKEPLAPQIKNEELQPEELQPLPEMPSAAAEEQTEKPEKIPAEGFAAQKPEETKEKKKNIKFLVLYTVIFVIVISGLIGGSYLVSTRIHQEMGQGNENTESTLKNIQVQNKELKSKNAELEAKNAQLTQQTKDAEALLESIGDMVEHDQYLAAAQNRYIAGQEETAKSIFRSIDREKLSKPNRAYYDTLKEKLGL
ncbi:MAG: hypothetical protein IJN80_08030 [Clostridia bacterium]|nr:hypothetical protein [Clostridia bacterium]